MVLSFGSAKEQDVLTLIAKKNYAKAIEVLKRGKADPRAKMQLADVLVMAGKSKEAVAVLAPLADEYAREGFAAKAVAVLKKIQKIDPSRRDVEQKLASLIQEKQRVATVSLPTVSSRGGMPEIGIEEIGMEPAPELGMEAGPELGMDADRSTPSQRGPAPRRSGARRRTPPAPRRLRDLPPRHLRHRLGPSRSIRSPSPIPLRCRPSPSCSMRPQPPPRHRQWSKPRSRRRSWTPTSSPTRTCSSGSLRTSSSLRSPLVEAEVVPEPAAPADPMSDSRFAEELMGLVDSIFEAPASAATAAGEPCRRRWPRREQGSRSS